MPDFLPDSRSNATESRQGSSYSSTSAALMQMHAITFQNSQCVRVGDFLNIGEFSPVNGESCAILLKADICCLQESASESLTVGSSESTCIACALTCSGNHSIGCFRQSYATVESCWKRAPSPFCMRKGSQFPFWANTCPNLDRAEGKHPETLMAISAA